MQPLIVLALKAILSHRLRSVLSTIGIAIGIASVVLLTSIGEGTRRYMVDQFTQFGTNLIAINPGRSETIGLPGALGGTTQKLSIDDMEALARLPGVDQAVPLTIGMARVESGARGRSVFVYGATPEISKVWLWGLRTGTFWSQSDPRVGSHTAVLGAKLKRELFGQENALGKFVRIAGTRFRVSGMMEPKGQLLGFDLDDAVFIPVATSMSIFNLDELAEIDIVFSHTHLHDRLMEDIRTTLMDRHRGKEDFTVTSQAGMMEVFGNVMDIITMAVGAIGGVSLVVGAIGILTMM